MQLFINSRGTYIHVNEGLFAIKANENELYLSAKKIISIAICAPVLLSTEAVRLAIENNIDILFLDKFGNPYGRIWHCRLGSTAAIRRAQLEAASNDIGLTLTREWLSLKISRRLALLRELLRRRPASSSQLSASLGKLDALRLPLQELQGDLDSIRSTLMGLEGAAGRIYFDLLSRLLPPRWKFDGRSHSPAKDHFNCFLNYGFGVLYGVVERNLILAGLDPYLGFLHTDNYGKKSLVFDFIEPYRPIVEKVVFHLFSGRRVKDAHCEQVPGGLSLSKEGKTLLVAALTEELDRVVRHGKRNLKQRDTILYDAHRTAQRLLKKKEEDFDFEVKEI